MFWFYWFYCRSSVEELRGVSPNIIFQYLIRFLIMKNEYFGEFIICAHLLYELYSLSHVIKRHYLILVLL